MLVFSVFVIKFDKNKSKSLKGIFNQNENKICFLKASV
jgi:hypothetical protein